MSKLKEIWKHNTGCSDHFGSQLFHIWMLWFHTVYSLSVFLPVGFSRVCQSSHSRTNSCFKQAAWYTGRKQSVHPSQSFSSCCQILLHFVMSNKLTAPGSRWDFDWHILLFAGTPTIVPANNRVKHAAVQSVIWFAGTSLNLHWLTTFQTLFAIKLETLLPCL